jgi:lipopolysaccharide biosynthesis glycosyltransferase
MTRGNVIVTAIFGDAYWRLADVSLPTIRAYANRLKVDLVVLEKRRFPDRHPYWEKFASADLLTVYERVCWIDVDAIVNPSAPSIFEAAPADAFSAFDEGKVFVDRQEQLLKDAEFYGADESKISSWAHRYFNIGVMVFGRSHADLFRQPSVAKKSSIMPEQTYLNLGLVMKRTRCHDLTSIWNGLHSIHDEHDRKHLNVVHYAGWPRTTLWVETMTEQMKADLENWS